MLYFFLINLILKILGKINILMCKAFCFGCSKRVNTCASVENNTRMGTTVVDFLILTCNKDLLFVFYVRCTIDWNKGKNITVKTIKKTQKHKGRGTKRTVTKTVQNDSFFNFFNPPEGINGLE